MPPIKTDKIKNVRAAIRELRAERRQFREDTFSANDLRRQGLSKSEIETIPSVTKFDETRYDRKRVREFLALR